MNTLTSQLTPHAHDMQNSFRLGVTEARLGMRKAHGPRSIWAHVRGLYGFKSVDTPLLTAPSENMKLGAATRLSYGLTLQHHSVKFVDGTRVNLCPWAGHCTKVCVLDNGSGAYPTVQRARIAKTHFLRYHPTKFAYLLGYELHKAADKADFGLDFRPNVNSDVQWELLLPNMLDGILLPSVWSYGYSKNQAILSTDGWVLPRYRVAFSANEACLVTDLRVHDFIKRGGSVAVVTNRNGDYRVKDDIRQWHRQFEVVDASKDDSWVFESGVIGDLAAKGKARKLIGKSGFVSSFYGVKTEVES